MPHKGHADPIPNNRPGFHSNMSISELTERVTRAIEASDISSAPPVVKNHRRGNARKLKPTPTEPNGARGLEKSWTRKETECAVAE